MCKCQMGSVNGIQGNGMPVEPITGFLYIQRNPETGGMHNKIGNGPSEPKTRPNVHNREGH